MSLQVWLPLNGNLNNQGLSEVTVTNSGATVASNGKIGSCYSFDTGKYITVTKPVALTKEISYSCWVNISSWNSATYDCILSIATGPAWNNSIATLCRNSSNTNLTWNIADGSSRGYVNSKTSLSLNTWYHIACTYDGAKLRIYINGVEDNSASTSLSPNYSSASLRIGSWSGDNYNLKGHLNDVRVYNHCLSAKEVKEISKGLICHYKLDNKGFGNPNILVTQSPASFSRQDNKYINTVADTRTNDTFNLQYYRGSTYVSTFFGKDVSTTPCYVKTTFTVPENMTGIRVKFNGASRDLELFTPDRAPVVAGETYTFSLKVLSSKSETVGGVQVENPKLEKGDKSTSWCPHTSDSLYTSLGLNSATEVDCSGLSNNGTKMGGLTPSTSPVSVRYESCYNFDGSTGSIQIPNLATLAPSGEFTMNCWIYHDNTWSSKSYETIFGGPSGFELEAKNQSTNSPVLHAWSWGKGEATYELNKWNMITMTRNASETKFYINGELRITGSAGTIPSGNYFIGAWNTSSQQNYKGKISDFRLYSTVLSAEDIKTLYNTSASVDKNGNMYAYEFKEE